MADRILLVENDAQLARLIAWILEDEGFQVQTAASAADVDDASLDGAGILVFDTDGAGAGEREMAGQLKARAGIPAIELGYRGDGDGRPHFAERTLSKPFAADDLVLTIRQLLDATAS